MPTASPLAMLTKPVRDYAALLTAKECAAFLNISARHWHRLVDGGRAPAPIRLGALVRWKMDGPGGLREWLDAGCPARR